jgi:hypothetical protein
MTDLYEPLRTRLRELGWHQVQRLKLTLWRRPDGAEFTEDEAFAQLQRIDKDGPNPASTDDRPV